MKRLMIMPVVLITAFLLCGCGIFHTYNVYFWYGEK